MRFCDDVKRLDTWNRWSYTSGMRRALHFLVTSPVKFAGWFLGMLWTVGAGLLIVLAVTALALIVIGALASR